ncbi:MAG TPA: capsular biosynthesis protein [Gammaproteobacteria bacterium]|nr:capsular biosynthesis protein [Gammaproteobacteria bacterium]
MRRSTARFIYLFLTLFVFSNVVSGQLDASSNLSDYKLGAGDLIEILVYGEEDLTLETRVSAEGVISYPFLGELRLSGLSVKSVETLIEAGLKGRYLINPRVTVSVLEYRQFYVNGEVEEPGGFPFVPGLTVQKAVSLAGGFTDRASRRKIYIIHEGQDEMQPRQVELSSPVNPGDIITVHESFF